MTTFFRGKIGIFLTALLLAFPATLPFFTMPSYAALPKLDQIRVALFIDARGSVPAVTLSSAKGLQVGVREPDKVHPWLTVNGNQAVRSSVDGYGLSVLQTPDYALARGVYNQLQGSGVQPYLFSVGAAGQAVYQVRAGSFSDAAAAASAKQRVAAKAPSVAGSIAVTGPLHWNAGTYLSLKDAELRLAALAQKGLYGAVAYAENAQGKLTYSVWLGDASSQAQLNEVKNRALQLWPELKLAPVDTQQAYLLRRNDLSLTASASAAMPHYMFNPKAKVWISPLEQGIEVWERSHRVYRGSIEVSQYNQQLAVINQLPFEQYLYSVVSTELSSSWPPEALKAQAVAARTYALTLGMKYKIAHISDTTFDQAYNGLGVEFGNAVAAVDQTAGEVLTDGNGLIVPFYSSNGGGMTADASEIWGTPVDYIQAVQSPDQDAQQGRLPWYRVVFPDGAVGYIRSDLVRSTGELNSAGLPYATVTEDGVNVRPAPYVDNAGNAAIRQANAGERFVYFEQDIESNAYNWIRGPFQPNELLSFINSRASASVSGPLETLEVLTRGPSLRATQVAANGKAVALGNPDNLRGAMGGLPSTRFEVDEMGRYSLIGSGGTVRHIPETKGPVYILGAQSQPRQLTDSNLFMINSGKQVRLAAREPQFRFIGYGNGHGIGMSQWGAKSWAELGYDYQKILKYYYKNVSIVKD